MLLAFTQLGFSSILALVILGIILGMVAYSIYFERKIAGWVQDRYGPNRVGLPTLVGDLLPEKYGKFHFWGLGQPIADGLKFFLKEDIIPSHVDKPLFLIAPCVSLIVALIGFVVIPWGGQVAIFGQVFNVQVANPDIGLLYILGVGSMGVYGVVLGGWASNNKYSVYGAVRATAQMLSYEIPMGVAIMCVVLTCGQVRLEEIMASQVAGWNVWNLFYHPVAFIILWITMFAETNRTPFDLAECEQELVGGFHTEYSAMKFAMFFLAEYAHMITGCAFLAVLFCGGWDPIPFVRIPLFRPEDTGIIAMLAKMAVLFGKVAFFMFMYMWVRWTVPRFRFDQLMRVAWKGLIPASLGVLAVAIAGLYLGLHRTLWFTLPGNVAVVLVSLWVMSRAKDPVSGREANLPPLTRSPELGVQA
ncbi:MAG: NADH-quinone oxidoreductase subunit H [Phycisphaerales bacterium]|nr:NADH-quinone oxidoreductase subunit H [Phycisphaerales bacterium]